MTAEKQKLTLRAPAKPVSTKVASSAINEPEAHVTHPASELTAPATFFSQLNYLQTKPILAASTHAWFKFGLSKWAETNCQFNSSWLEMWTRVNQDIGEYMNNLSTLNDFSQWYALNLELVSKLRLRQQELATKNSLLVAQLPEWKNLPLK